MTARHYFVAYSHSRGFGSCEVFRDRPIETWDDVQDVRQQIADVDRGSVYLDQIVIISWQPLGGDAR